MRAVGLLFLVLTLSSPALAGELEIVEHTAVVGRDGVQEVEITGGYYYFRPNYIVLKKDIPARFVVRKTPGLIGHDIVIDELEAGMAFKVDLGTEGKVIEFTPTRVGVYPFYCDRKFLFFRSHRDRGMEGLIEVVE